MDSLGKEVSVQAEQALDSKGWPEEEEEEDDDEEEEESSAETAAMMAVRAKSDLNCMVSYFLQKKERDEEWAKIGCSRRHLFIQKKKKGLSFDLGNQTSRQRASSNKVSQSCPSCSPLGLSVRHGPWSRRRK